MNTHIPILDGKLRLYGFVDGKSRERVVTSLGGFKPEWNGEVLNVLDWKLNGETGRLTYQIRDDAYAPIFDQDFPIIQERFPLQPPTRSKNWTWNEFSECWINRKTGQRIKVY